MREVIFWNSISLIPEILHYSASLATSRWNEVKAFTCRGRHLALITYHLLQYQKEKKKSLLFLPLRLLLLLLLLTASYDISFLSRLLQIITASSICPPFLSLRTKIPWREFLELKITKANRNTLQNFIKCTSGWETFLQNSNSLKIITCSQTFIFLLVEHHTVAKRIKFLPSNFGSL